MALRIRASQVSIRILFIQFLWNLAFYRADNETSQVFSMVALLASVDIGQTARSGEGQDERGRCISTQHVMDLLAERAILAGLEVLVREFAIDVVRRGYSWHFDSL